MVKVGIKSDLRMVSLKEMVDILNEVSESENGSITVESEGIINFPMAIYDKSRGCEWDTHISSKVKDGILYKELMIVDYTFIEGSFNCDSLEIIGDILYDKYMNQFRFSLSLDLEIIISIYDYEFYNLY